MLFIVFDANTLVTHIHLFGQSHSFQCTTFPQFSNNFCCTWFDSESNWSPWTETLCPSDNMRLAIWLVLIPDKKQIIVPFMHLTHSEPLSARCIYGWMTLRNWSVAIVATLILAQIFSDENALWMSLSNHTLKGQPGLIAYRAQSCFDSYIAWSRRSMIHFNT